MKNVLYSMVIFAILLISVFYSINYLNKSCSNLESLDTKLETLIEESSWDNAYATSLELMDDWDNYSKVITIFVNHAEIDNINSELWKLTQYTKFKNRDESMASVHTIKFYLGHIMDMEKVNMQNIL
ncbi:MAG: DUF4363 family protein [Solirubrobacterales bacterium]